jgi:uncharacterized repeat protein (TIGR01451 family)
MPTPPPETATLDLTVSGTFGAVADGLFATSQIQSAGTGTFNAFVQIQHNGTEQGYNTDARPQQFDEKNSTNHNHSILLASIPIVVGDGSNGTNEGTLYREFRLDINETGDFLSLDALQIWQEESGSLTGFTPGVGFSGSHTNYLAYNLDAGGDHWVALNDGLSHGSGESDITVLIPDSFFINDVSHRFVTIYSSFGSIGGDWSADGGVEEWGLSGPSGGPIAALNIVKQASVPGGSADAVGEEISYSIMVSNVGSLALTGVTVTDPLVSDLTRGLDAVGDNDNILEVGEVWSYTAHHTVTQEDIDAAPGEGFITNTATADSDQTGPDTASASVPVDWLPHVTLVKDFTITSTDGVPDTTTVDAVGDVIHYTIAVTNDGNATLTQAMVTDSTINIVTPVLDLDAPIEDPNVQVFIPVLDGDFNLGDTNQNGVRNPGETFQFLYPGDTNQNGFHDPGETWSAVNLGDTNNNGIHELGETWAGDTNQNGIEEDGERWQFKNLGDANDNGLQDSGETWQYANVGDDNQNGVEDPGETWEFRNVGDTNQNGVQDAGETFQFYNAGDTNRDGVENDGETFQFTVSHAPAAVDTNNDGFNDGDTNFDNNLSVGETWH